MTKEEIVRLNKLTFNFRRLYRTGELPDDIVTELKAIGFDFQSRYDKLAERNLATENPQLAAEWHPTKNGELTPSDVTPSSNKKVWWKCSKCGHEWQVKVNGRACGAGCPACAGKFAVSGDYNLATKNPQLAAEWHPTKNGELTPSDVTPGSGKKVWWKCSKCGHEWQARIGSRTQGSGCPVCAGRITVSDVNDLATKNPQLAADWHPTKNGELTPSDVTPGTHRKVWWKCSKCGHEWQAKISNRTYGNGCPVCARHNRTSKRLRDLTPANNRGTI